MDLRLTRRPAARPVAGLRLAAIALTLLMVAGCLERPLLEPLERSLPAGQTLSLTLDDLSSEVVVLAMAGEPGSIVESSFMSRMQYDGPLAEPGGQDLRKICLPAMIGGTWHMAPGLEVALIPNGDIGVESNDATVKARVFGSQSTMSSGGVWLMPATGPFYTILGLAERDYWIESGTEAALTLEVGADASWQEIHAGTMRCDTRPGDFDEARYFDASWYGGIQHAATDLTTDSGLLIWFVVDGAGGHAISVVGSEEVYALDSGPSGKVVTLVCIDQPGDYRFEARDIARSSPNDHLLTAMYISVPAAVAVDACQHCGGSLNCVMQRP